MHTMTKLNEHEGKEEWLCYSCGRHLLVSWNPVLTAVVLQEGDTSEIHTGLKPNMPAGAKRELPTALQDDPRLEPWIVWMNESNFESLWDRDLQ